LFTAADYFTFLNASLAGEYDLLITGPHFGVLCLKAGYQPLVRYRAVLQPVFVVRKGGDVHRLDDLRGRRIGLSSRLSISSIGGVKWLLDNGLQIGPRLPAVRARHAWRSRGGGGRWRTGCGTDHAYATASGA
jgi:phosphonate transport system substrate-binding protein